MDIALYLYLLAALLWWQIVGNKSKTLQQPELVSSVEQEFWFSNDPKGLLAHVVANYFWIFLIAYPIYWGIKFSVVQAIVILLVGNIGIILLGAIFKKLFRLPEILLVHFGCVLCPVIAIVIWFFK